MSTDAIRQQLYDYIRVAEDRKLYAIFTLLEKDIAEESADWHSDVSIVAEIDRPTEEYKSGHAKGIPWEALKARILTKEK